MLAIYISVYLTSRNTHRRTPPAGTQSLLWSFQCVPLQIFQSTDTNSHLVGVCASWLESAELKTLITYEILLAGHAGSINFEMLDRGNETLEDELNRTLVSSAPLK